jgi:hypothetical protein
MKRRTKGEQDPADRIARLPPGDDHADAGVDQDQDARRADIERG